VVRTSVTHSAIASCATFLFLPHFDVICDLLLDRCTATWNLFVLCNKEINFVRIKTALFHIRGGGEELNKLVNETNQRHNA